MAKIKTILPTVAEEISSDTSAKIYHTADVAKAYPEMQQSLIHDGSQAYLPDLALGPGRGLEFR